MNPNRTTAVVVGVPVIIATAALVLASGPADAGKAR